MSSVRWDDLALVSTVSLFCSSLVEELFVSGLFSARCRFRALNWSVLICIDCDVSALLSVPCLEGGVGSFLSSLPVLLFEFPLPPQDPSGYR